jgi:hypothetical protein
MPDEYEEVHVVDHGDHVHEQRIIHEVVPEQQVVHDVAVEARGFAYRFSSLIWMAFGLLIGLIALRVFLKLIAANPASPFAGMLYAFTDIFLWPFAGLTVAPAVGGMVLEIPAIIGMFVYALLAWAIVRLIRFLFYRP